MLEKIHTSERYKLISRIFISLAKKINGNRIAFTDVIGLISPEEFYIFSYSFKKFLPVQFFELVNIGGNQPSDIGLTNAQEEFETNINHDFNLFRKLSIYEREIYNLLILRYREDRVGGIFLDEFETI